jgi:hypothetical protein
MFILYNIKPLIANADRQTANLIGRTKGVPDWAMKQVKPQTGAVQPRLPRSGVCPTLLLRHPHDQKMTVVNCTAGLSTFPGCLSLPVLGTLCSTFTSSPLMRRASTWPQTSPPLVCRGDLLSSYNIGNTSKEGNAVRPGMFSCNVFRHFFHNDFAALLLSTSSN